MVKRWLHRALVTFLCAAVFVCFAGSISTDSVFAAEGDVTRAEWLTSLVDTFDMTVEGDEVLPDNYFSDLDSSSEYYRDFLVAVEFGLVDVEAGEPVYPEEPVTREFAAHTLNYCLGFQLEDGTEYSFSDADEVADPDSAQVAVNRGWMALIGGRFSPASNITGSEKNTMLADAAAVWGSTEVDDSHKDTYKVKEGITEVPSDTQATILEDGTLKISDCPEEIKAGDVFVVHLNGIPVAYTAVSVEAEGSDLLIQTEDVDPFDAFDELELEGTLDGNAEFIVEPAKGVEMTVENAPETKVQKLARKISGKAPVKIRDLKFDGKIDLGAGMYTKFNAKVSNILITYKVSLTNQSFVKMTGNMNMSCSAGLSMDMLEGMDKTIAQVGVPGVGGIDLIAEVNLAGKVTVSTKGNLTLGVSASLAEGIRAIKSFKATGFSCVTEVSAYAGVQARMGIYGSAVPFKGYCYAKTGVNGLMMMADYDYDGPPWSCVTHAGWISAEYGAKVSCKALHIDKTWSETIYDENNSPVRVYHHYEDRAEVAKCTRESDFIKHARPFGYYTKAGSPFWGNGWANGMGSYGFDEDGNAVPVFTFTTFENEKAEKEAKITGYTGNAYCLNIPETVSDEEGEYTVTVIGSGAFKDRSDLVNLSIPDTVTMIEANAFYNCPNIYSLVLPDSITEIGQFAFAKCTNLGSLTLPAKVTKICGGAFAVCNSLESVMIPKSLTTTTAEYDPSIKKDYHYGIFMNSTGLSNVTFEEGITAIAPGVLANTLGLEEIVIPDTVTTIGHEAFKDCVNLQNVTFPQGLTTIGAAAFYNCSSITEIVMPDTVTEVQKSAFALNSSLTHLVLSKGLKKIYGAAFGKCDALTSVEIPKSITETTSEYEGVIMYDYHYGVFMKCANLTDITFEEGITTIPNGIFANIDGLKEITIPDTVTKINPYAFESCKYLETVNFSKNLLRIDGHAFYGCSSIEKLEIPDSVTQIDEFAFAFNSSLKDLKLSNHLSKVGGGAFGRCDELGTVTIPKSLKEIYSAYDYSVKYDYHKGLFMEGQGPKKVIFEEGTTSIVDGLLEFSRGLNEVVIPDGVKSIGDNAFQECTALETATLPDSVTSLGSAFSKCSALKTSNIPKDLTAVPAYLFYNCASLESITIPDKIVTINNNAFEGAGLKTLELPESVTTIGTRAFYGNSNLTKVTVNGTLKTIGERAFMNCDKMAEINLPDGLTSIAAYAFYNCDALTDVVLPNSVTSLGNYAYSGCAALKSISLGNGITSLGTSVLSNCEKLSSVTLPNTLTTIGSKVFENDTALKEIFIPRTVTSIDSTAFSYYSQLTVYGVKGTYAETFAGEQGAAFVERNIPVEDISLNKTLDIAVGKTEKLNLVLTPADTTDEITWVSSDTSIATVGSNGTVKGVSPGTATIRVYVGDDLTASCKVTVYRLVDRIYMRSSVTLEALETCDLDVSVSPSSASNQEIKYSSSDPSIAEVDDKGVVTAKQKGEATITAEAQDGSNVKATCKVTVSNSAFIVTSADQLESEHRYANNCTDIWIYTLEGAEILAVTFNEQTEFEEDFDYLYIYSGTGTEVGHYTGTELAGKTVTVLGDTVRIKLNTNAKGTAWGFKVDSVEAVDEPVNPEDCEHSYSDDSWQYYDDKQHVRRCEKCGAKQYADHDLDFDETVKAPTLTEPGEDRYRCYDCKAYISKASDPKTYGECGDWVDYSFDAETGTLTIYGDGEMHNYAAGESPFDGQTAIKEIIIEDGVTTIGNNAFRGASGVESISLPVSVSSIGTGALSGCSPSKIEYEGTEEDFNEISMDSDVADIIDNAEKEWGDPDPYGPDDPDPYGEKIDISTLDAEMDEDTFVYDGTEWEPYVCLYDEYDYELYEGVDYELSYRNNINAGTATVVITGIGDFTGKQVMSFRIKPAPLPSSEFAMNTTSFIYGGKAVIPVPSYGYLTKDKDFKLTYANNNAVGIATVKATGVGNYTGSWSARFTINPKGTTLSKVTSAKKGFTAKWRKQAVQTTGYQLQYGLKSNFKGAKTVTVKKTSTVSKKVKKLKARKKYYVRIRTYKKAGGKTYYSKWSKPKTVKTKK